MSTPIRTVTIPNRNPCTIGAKSLFKAINNRTPLPREARRFFERTRPKVQCNNVIGKKPEYCWICGGVTFIPNHVWFSPQCEHVLPIAQGVIFLELYNHKFKNIDEAVKLEYEWAHAICNNVKNATVLIEGNERMFQPNEIAIQTLLNKLSAKGVIIHDKQLEKMKTRLTEVTNYINQLEDFIVIPANDCAVKLDFTKEEYEPIPLETKVIPELVDEREEEYKGPITRSRSIAIENGLLRNPETALPPAAKKQRRGGKTFRRKNNGYIRQFKAGGYGTTSRVHRKSRTRNRKYA